MHERLMSFITKYNILYSHQFGFQHGRSTEQAIISICSKIVNSIENKKNSCCVFLDFAKAFVTVNHDILIK